MCATCGCSETDEVTVTDLQAGERVVMTRPGLHAGAAMPGHAHDHHHDFIHPHHDHGHDHGHDHDHGHVHGHGHRTVLTIEQDILAKNQQLAERNRGWLEGRGILALNLVSSPGSGKTTLLERTLHDLKGRLNVQVIEGDQATANDAERIRATGCRVVQINTGTCCHLEADMIAQALRQLSPTAGAVVMIENIGNLVCPALFDLGEHAKVAIVSVTEGEDKPAKYPHMFRASELLLISKIDLLPYVDFDVDRCIAHAREINPSIRTLSLSARSGAGMQEWYDWLQGEAQSTIEAQVRS